MESRVSLFREQCSRCRFSVGFSIDEEPLTCSDCELYLNGRCLCMDAPDEDEVSCKFFEPYKGGL